MGDSNLGGLRRSRSGRKQCKDAETEDAGGRELVKSTLDLPNGDIYREAHVKVFNYLDGRSLTRKLSRLRGAAPQF